MLAYLSRYTHRVAIANSRLIACDRAGVTFRWKDYRAEGRDRQKVMTLATGEFIRRFLIHVLPPASTASATMACSPAAPAPTTSPERVNCWPFQNLKASPPLPTSIPASRLVHAAAAA